MAAKRIEQAVRSRAALRCEYCHLPESVSDLPHVVDHIRAIKHHGRTTLENLALCCGRCNLSKGPNVAGIDPATQRLTRLFNPRKDAWHGHFRWHGAVLIGVTSIGRTTVDVLDINNAHRLAARRVLSAAGKIKSD
jgi:hypothetical protein